MEQESKWIYLYDVTPWSPDWQPKDHPCTNCGESIPLPPFPVGRMIDITAICPSCGITLTIRRYENEISLVSFWQKEEEKP